MFKVKDTILANKYTLKNIRGKTMRNLISESYFAFRSLPKTIAISCPLFLPDMRMI